MWAECTCAGVRMGISLSFSVARVSSVPPTPRSATRCRASKYNAGSRYAGALSLISTPHSVRRVEHSHVLRLITVFLSLHVAVEPSEMRRVLNPLLPVKWRLNTPGLKYPAKRAGGANGSRTGAWRNSVRLQFRQWPLNETALVLVLYSWPWVCSVRFRYE